MKYCPEITTAICKHLKDGMWRKDACILENICFDTFCEWMKKPEFSDAVKSAEIRCKKESVDIIRKAAKRTWQAAAWWLERKNPEEFALKTIMGGMNGEGKFLPYSMVVTIDPKVFVNGNGNGNGKDFQHPAIA